MQIEFRKTDALCPYARNLRRIDQAVEQMVASIREFRFKISMLVRSDGDVVAGHLRLKAALAEHPDYEPNLNFKKSAIEAMEKQTKLEL